jgi:hypothetical protein
VKIQKRYKEYNSLVFRDLMPNDYSDENKGTQAATLRSNQIFKNFELGINLMTISTRLNHTAGRSTPPAGYFSPRTGPT